MSGSELDELLAVLAGREHWPRVEAIEALGAGGHAAAVPALLEVVGDDAFECWHTKAAALRALAALGARDAGALMQTVVRDTAQDPDVRIAAAEALGALGDPDAAVALRSVAARERGNDVGKAAREALANLGSPATPGATE